jgi:8-oxo-dGTP diphosphatase
VAAILPYQVAVLCYLFDQEDRILLLHRVKHPNRDLYSPVGGKLEQQHGESPTGCAVREIWEETGLTIQPTDLHLTGIVSEAGFDDQTHWLMFLYEVNRPVVVTRTDFQEGRLEWHHSGDLQHLPIPQTDRLVLWPLFWKYRRQFFTAHIDCHGGDLRWRLEQPANDAHGPSG